MAKRLKQEEIEKAREDFRKRIEQIPGTPLDPALQEFMNLIASVLHSEEAKETLREEIVKSHGE